MRPTASCCVGLLAEVDFKWRGYDSHSSLTMNYNSPWKQTWRREGEDAEVQKERPGNKSGLSTHEALEN